MLLSVETPKKFVIDSKADYLATGDKELFVLKRIGKTRIITLHKLEEILK